MVRHEYPKLFADDPVKLRLAEHLANITWELTEFLVEGLGISDLKASLPEPRTFAFHDACHGLRVLGLGQESRTLISHIENATVEEMPGCDVCCGFGGLFSVKMADISGVMLTKKMAQIKECPAQVLTGDSSCLLHMNGGLERQHAPQRVNHIADILAEAIRGGSRENTVK
jgi:L-lactate dehydrogenase complex protein LldE